MSGGVLNEAAWVKAPMAGNSIELVLTTTTGTYIIPEAFAGQQTTWKVFAASGSIYAAINFGTSTVTAVIDTASTVGGSGTITPSTSTGFRVDSGQIERFVMPAITSDCTHFAVDASGTGRLVITKQ